MSAPSQQLADYLQTLPYFEDTDRATLERLAERAARFTFDPDETIFFEGDPSAGLWLIQAGRVKIFKLSPAGKAHILHILGPGDTFNDISALDGGPNPADAVALSGVVVWNLPREVLVQALAADAELALKVIQVLARRVRSLVGQIEDLALYSVVTRLARFLLKQLEDPSLSGPGVTRTAIAAHINTTPQTISNALRSLEEAGAIDFDRHHIQIIDEALLRDIAEQ